MFMKIIILGIFWLSETISAENCKLNPTDLIYPAKEASGTFEFNISNISGKLRLL